MADERKNFGDEEFIYHMGLQTQKQEREREAQEKHKNNILDGYIIIGDEEILFDQTKILDECMSIIMPKKFELMSKEIADIKYPSINRPDIIYTTPETDINFTLSLQEEIIENKDIPEAKDLIQNAMKRMIQKVISSDTIEVNEKNIAYFDYISPALDTDIYNLMFFMSVDGCLLIGSCNCPDDGMNEWKPVFMQMLESIEIESETN